MPGQSVVPEIDVCVPVLDVTSIPLRDGAHSSMNSVLGHLVELVLQARKAGEN